MEQQIIPYDESLQQFKKYVTAWVELDNVIRKLQETMREKRKLKERVQEKITEFMSTYRVEDVNTKEVKLRYKVTKARTPLKRADVKQRAVDHYGSEKADEIMTTLFEQRDVVERPTLRRLRVGGQQLVLHGT